MLCNIATGLNLSTFKFWHYLCVILYGKSNNDHHISLTGCSSKPQERMQVPWRNRKLHFKIVLEAAWCFWERGIGPEEDIPWCCQSEICGKQAARTHHQGSTSSCFSKRQKAGISWFFSQLLRAKPHRRFAWNAGKDMQGRRGFHRWM